MISRDLDTHPPPAARKQLEEAARALLQTALPPRGAEPAGVLTHLSHHCAPALNPKEATTRARPASATCSRATSSRSGWWRWGRPATTR
ncbi:hypothetical protein [Nonomuraea typhae]|uniref:Uncharacterized protein n=1 Tax=Nonomuraea typhae TaxID=2603600 RepID=A0ABW7YTS6_9ACTN